MTEIEKFNELVKELLLQLSASQKLAQDAVNKLKDVFKDYSLIKRHE